MTQPSRPTITIAIAAYNCAATVGATLDSCLAQTHPGVEVLVVDDGSTDSTPAVLASYGDRIRVIRQVNGGLANARNTGMHAAQGEFIAWMDADDLCVPDRLLVQAAVLERFPEVVVVSSNFTAFRPPEPSDNGTLYLATYYSAPGRLGGLDAIYAKAETIDTPGASSAKQFSLRRGRVYEPLLNGNFVHPPTVMLRRSALASAGDCDSALRYTSDYEWLVRASRLGEFALVEAPLLRYRLSDAQMSKAAFNGTMQLEAIAILDRIRQADPPLYERQHEVFASNYARTYLSAAYAIGSANRRQSLKLLACGLAHHARLGEALRILGRILLPQWLLAALRQLRARPSTSSS